jgi:hypothetical protein
VSMEKAMMDNFIALLRKNKQMDVPMQDLPMTALEPILVPLAPGEQCGQCGQATVDCRMMPCGLDLGSEGHRMMQVDASYHSTMGEAPTVLFFEHFPSALPKLLQFAQASKLFPTHLRPPPTIKVMGPDGVELGSVLTEQILLSDNSWEDLWVSPPSEPKGRWTSFGFRGHVTEGFSLRHLGVPDASTLDRLMYQLGLRNLQANKHPNDHHLKHCTQCQHAVHAEDAELQAVKHKEERKDGACDARISSPTPIMPPPRAPCHLGTVCGETHGFTRDSPSLAPDPCAWAASSYLSLYAVILSQRGGSDEHYDMMSQTVGEDGPLEACDANGLSVLGDAKIWATAHPSFFDEHLRWLKSCTPTTQSLAYLHCVDELKVQPLPFRGTNSCGPILARDYARRAQSQFPGCWLHMHKHGSSGYSMPYMVRRGVPHMVYDVNRSLVFAWDYFAASGMVQSSANTIMQLGKASEKQH